MTGHLAAVDLGAASGRVALGRVGPRELHVETVARFANHPVPGPDGLRWDFTGLYRQAREGLAAAARQAGGLAGIGVDSWAVDYGLLRGGELLGEPFCYRDERTAAGVAAVHARIDPEALFARNGLQFLPFTTLYQLAAETDRLAAADTVLLLPDLLAFWLSGARVAERTNASTTGLLDIGSGTWDAGLAALAGVPDGALPPLVDAGTVLGGVLPAAAEAMTTTPAVVAVGSHDTASAVVGIPFDPERSAYISCGSWGLVGVELAAPVLSAAARAANFTNEGGVDGRIRFLHNVMGLWLLDESVRAWSRDGEPVDLAELLAAAAGETRPVAVFDANDPRFLAPGDIPSRIADWCREHGAAPPAGRAEVVRSIVESVAEGFAAAVRSAAELSGVAVETVHLGGGGARNALLCQRTADRSGLPVLAGPVEATAIGNLLVQARALGMIRGSLDALRALVAAAFPPRRFTPVSAR